ncbi:glycosyltransferase [Rothia amarae]|uniref:Glycosyltransferase n=1 Tax=Rothia amarae TaxID=169480 RepID=A0A7H2BIH4_9MICC|nr:glycosyltransferase [Rothia amarae]QNV39470.1 glycosyltransferase [Rothia amarae]
MMFSAIIPTMQGSSYLKPLLKIYENHNLIDEILIINNSNRKLEISEKFSKLREIYHGENIYVNPAWNIGAEHAIAEYLLISNDDIIIEPELIDNIANSLKLNPTIGLLGAARETVYEPEHHSCRDYSIYKVHEVPAGYGVLFALKRENYKHIPANMKIYAGEYWIFWNQDNYN